VNTHESPGVEARLSGVLPPLVTPFKLDGSLDLAAFEANLDTYAGADLAGYLVLGSNGEASVLEPDEKLELVKAARRRTPSARRLLVGTGLESTRGTIELTRRVADLGAEGVLVLTPHYYRAQMTTEVLQRYFEAVADASPVPVYLYSVPVFTGIPFPLELAVRLAEHPNVRGMKESSGDVALLGRIVASVPPTFQVACGSAPVLYPALCQGAVAAVLAVACCVPALPVAIFRAHAAGDHTRARTLQQVLTPLAVAVTATYGVAGLKAACDAAGLRGGAVRAPLQPISDAGRALVASLVRDAEAALR
jgi:4-hydroxy-2-oxoglutarate aldolase